MNLLNSLMGRGLGGALGVILLDQLTKQWALNALVPYQPVPIFPSFNLTLVFNYGAAFSLLAQQGGWQRWFFVGLAVLATIVLTIWLRRLQAGQWRLALALALMIGGAMGNAIDRIIFGYVIDFLDFYYGGWHWPAFNLADSALCIGAVLLLLEPSPKKTLKPTPPSSEAN